MAGPFPICHVFEVEAGVGFNSLCQSRRAVSKSVAPMINSLISTTPRGPPPASTNCRRKRARRHARSRARHRPRDGQLQRFGEEGVKLMWIRRPDHDVVDLADG